ncbi:MAG: FxsA family protein, partial [Candidatus Thiodiazotropha endolucinida]
MGMAPRVSSSVMNPLLLLLLLFVGVPLVELYFLIEVGSQIGAFSTIFLTVFTALLG